MFTQINRKRTKLGATVGSTVLLALGLLGGGQPVTAEPFENPCNNNVVARYAPVVYFHHEEDYFPMHASDFIKNSSLKLERSENEPVLIKSRGFEPARLKRYWKRRRPENRHDHGYFLDFEGSDGVRRGNRPSGGSGAQVYYRYVACDYIVYWFFFGFSDGPTTFGDHEGDWEHVVVELGADNTPTGVTFHQHNGSDHINWSSVMKFQGTHPRVFSGRGSHASFGSPGRHGTDVTEDYDLTRWQTWLSLRNVLNEPWYGYTGAWGATGPNKYSTGPAGPSQRKVR